MRNLKEYSFWLVLVIINAVIVSQWINYLILISGESAGLAAGVFISIFLASLMFLLIRSAMTWHYRRRYEGRFQATETVKAVGVTLV